MTIALHSITIPTIPVDGCWRRTSMARFLSFGFVSRIVAMLLIVAAFAKLYGLAADPVSKMGYFSSTEFQLAILEFEFILGLWLLSGFRPFVSWAVTLATFFCFAGISLNQGFIGASSCECFGQVAVNPWLTFVLDVAIFCILVLSRPTSGSTRREIREKFPRAIAISVCSIAGIILISGAMIAAAIGGFGSFPAAIAYFRGERISVHPRLLNVGDGREGETRSGSVTLTNWTKQQIELFGGTADCSCTVLQDLPMKISPSESRTLTIRVDLKGKPGIFTRKASFLVNDNGFKKVSFQLTGQIRSGKRIGMNHIK